MNLRDVILHNLHWKALALALAIFAWLSINGMDPSEGKEKSIRQSANQDNPEDGSEETIDVEVLALTTPSDSRSYRIEPPSVRVKLWVTTAGASALERQGVQVYVDLSDAVDGLRVRSDLQALPPLGVEVIEIEPKRVDVEHVENSN